MKLFRKLKVEAGMTLIEVLLAISLFAMVAVISSNILVDVAQLEKKSSLQNAIYEDLRIILQQLTTEIQNGTIDYEEYYSYYVLQKGHVSNDVYYGINYGIYGSRFYDPGKRLDGDLTYNPNDLSMECSFPGNLIPGTECEVAYTLSTDLNAGQNPFDGNATVSNAFCDNNIGKDPCEAKGLDHLFLIDNSGTKKTIIAKKSIGGGSYALGLMRMEGFDLDQNGIIDTFSCKNEFNCDKASEIEDINKFLPLGILYPDDGYYDNIYLPNKSDLFVDFQAGNLDTTQFVPISPLRSNVDVAFIINPLEDPYKAFAETAAQAHPSVTIILTVDLTEEAAKDYPGEFKPIQVQTTVAAGVIGKIDSYPPVNEFKNSGDTSWILKAMEHYGWAGNLKAPYL